MGKGRIAVTFFLSLLAGAGQGEYVVTPLHRSDWESLQSKTLCQLLHNVGHFGQAGFLHYSGEPLQFFLQENQFQASISRASLYVEPSPWRDSLVYKQDYPVFLDDEAFFTGHRLVVFANAAEDMLDTLMQGHYPVFSLVRRSEEIRVKVSSVNFTESYERFAECRKALLPFGEKQLEQDNLYFAPQSSILSGQLSEKLRQVSDYLQEIPAARAVVVSATALAGKADQKWFAKRAEQIVKRLQHNGVARNRIVVGKSASRQGKDNEILLKVFSPDALTRFYFRKGNISLTANEKQRLALLARYVQDNFPQGQIVISSHTDSKGGRGSNLKISQQRGDVVKDYLVAQGIEPNRLLVKAYGESRPIKSNRFPTGRAQNRRVVISFAN